MEALTIRCLSERPDLAETCAAWSFGQWGCHFPGGHFDKSLSIYKAAAAAQGNVPRTWVGLVQDKIAGMISLRDTDHPDHRDLFPWLASFFIHPSFRGRGFAHAFLRHIDAQIRALGFGTAYLFTPDAQDLYARHGWDVFDKTRDPLGLKPHVVLMSKSF